MDQSEDSIHFIDQSALSNTCRQHTVLTSEPGGGNLQTRVKVARVLSLSGGYPGAGNLGAGVQHLVGPVVALTKGSQCQRLEMYT